MDERALYTEIKEQLQRRLAVIADHDWRDRDPAGHLEALKTVSERLALLEKAVPRHGAPPKLNHYLQQCSYAKALALLEGWTAS